MDLSISRQDAPGGASLPSLKCGGSPVQSWPQPSRAWLAREAESQARSVTAAGTGAEGNDSSGPAPRIPEPNVFGVYSAVAGGTGRADDGAWSG